MRKFIIYLQTGSAITIEAGAMHATGKEGAPGYIYFSGTDHGHLAVFPLASVHGCVEEKAVKAFEPITETK